MLRPSQVDNSVRSIRAPEWTGGSTGVLATGALWTASAILSKRVSKGVESGLTAAVNLFVPSKTDTISPNLDVELTPEDIRAGIERDFKENAYMWTGDFTADLYTDDCVFTFPDDTLEGLPEFQTLMAIGKWQTFFLVDKYKLELFTCELNEDSCTVVATWRSTGNLRFPWKPAVDLEGRSTFTYAPERGNRIVSCDEKWGTSDDELFEQIIRTAGEQEEIKVESEGVAPTFPVEFLILISWLLPFIFSPAMFPHTQLQIMYAFLASLGET